MTTPPSGPWQVGELAALTGLSVRALHHYDELGILTPSQRSASGYRLYGKEDLEKLQRVLSLKQLGFTLEQIKDCLQKPEFSLQGVLQMHVQKLQRQVAVEQELSERLSGLLRFFEFKKQTDITVEDFLGAIALMNRTESYFSQDQLQDIHARSKAMGEEGMRSAEAEWPALMAKMTEAMEQGTDPSDPAVQTMAKRWRELIDAFTGGNKEIEANLKKMYQENPDARKQYGGPDPKLMAYVAKAWDAAHS